MSTFQGQNTLWDGPFKTNGFQIFYFYNILSVGWSMSPCWKGPVALTNQGVVVATSVSGRLGWGLHPFLVNSLTICPPLLCNQQGTFSYFVLHRPYNIGSISTPVITPRHHYIALLHELRELSHLPRAMKIVSAISYLRPDRTHPPPPSKLYKKLGILGQQIFCTVLRGGGPPPSKVYKTPSKGGP